LSRGGRPRAALRALVSRSSFEDTAQGRSQALARAVTALGNGTPQHRVGGANGLGRLDTLELQLADAHPEWPAAQHPKRLWGEFGGSGGQLLAAALLEPSDLTLVTAPASSGSQFAALLEGVKLDRP